MLLAEAEKSAGGKETERNGNEDLQLRWFFNAYRNMQISLESNNNEKKWLVFELYLVSLKPIEYIGVYVLLNTKR